MSTDDIWRGVPPWGVAQSVLDDSIHGFCALCDWHGQRRGYSRHAAADLATHLATDTHRTVVAEYGEIR